MFNNKRERERERELVSRKKLILFKLILFTVWYHSINIKYFLKVELYSAKCAIVYH